MCSSDLGADALRFALATGNAPGNDMRFSDEKIEAARNFANKLWNASRFVLMNMDEDTPYGLPPVADMTTEDKWILSRFNALAKEVNENLEHYELGVALSSIYDFAWDVFCDWYIELCKSRLYERGSEGAKTAIRVLNYVLTGTLKLLHPYMPFITEEIYQALPHEDESIMISAYPVYDEALSFPAEEADMNRIIDAIRAIRARRAEMNVQASRKTKLYLVTKMPEVFRAAEDFFCKLAFASELFFPESYTEEGAVSIVTDAVTIYIPLADMIDFEKEKARLTKELEKTAGEIARLSGKLSNAGFLAKAPEAVVAMEKEKLAKYEATKASLEAELAKLG